MWVVVVVVEKSEGVGCMARVGACAPTNLHIQRSSTNYKCACGSNHHPA